MATDNRTRPEQNLAHLPVVDDFGQAPNTHTSPTTHESVAPSEIAAGTTAMRSQPVATAIDPRSVRDFGPTPMADSTHGARITPITPHSDAARPTWAPNRSE